MTNTKYPASQARINFAELINRVAFGGERIILNRHEKDLVALISLADLRALEISTVPGHLVNSGEENARLAAIVKSSNDAIIGKTLDGIITSWNPSAERLYGYSADEIVGLPVSTLLPPNWPNEVPEFLQKIRRGEQVNHYETKRARKDGTVIDVSLTISPIKDRADRVIGASTIARDITDWKKAVEEIRVSREQLRALSAKLQILQEEERSRIAKELQKEFGQALTALKLDLAWLSKRLPVNREPLTQKIESMLKRLDTTIQNIRKISTELKPTALDELGFAAALEWEIKEFQQRTGIECLFKIIPDDISLNSSQSIVAFRILQEILQNLVGATRRAIITISINYQTNILQLEVVAKESRNIEVGALNLVSIRERARLLGGLAQLNSSNGDTIFLVEIPVPQQPRHEAKAATRSNLPERARPKSLHQQRKAVNRSTIRILIADSYAIMREGLKQILAEIPDVVVAGEADSGKQVLEKLRKSRWDLLVMDLSLPDKSGLDILKQIKEEFPKLPVLVMSAQSAEQYALRLLKAGAAGYLNKESAPKLLIRAVQKIARGGRFINESIAEKLLIDLGADPAQLPHKRLTDREFQVLCMIAAGKRLIDIAEELHLSIKTISTHKNNLMQKMGMSSNVELVHYAIEHNLIS